MSLLLAGIGAGLSLGSSIFGGVKAAGERRKADQLYQDESRRLDNWFKEEYNRDLFSRSDVKGLLSNMRERMNEQNKITNNTAVVTGATPEWAATQRMQSNRAYGDVVSNVGSYANQWKSDVMNNYLNQKSMMTGNRYNSLTDNARYYTNIGLNGLSSTAGYLDTILSKSRNR